MFIPIFWSPTGPRKDSCFVCSLFRLYISAKTSSQRLPCMCHIGLSQLHDTDIYTSECISTSHCHCRKHQTLQNMYQCMTKMWGYHCPFWAVINYIWAVIKPRLGRLGSYKTGFYSLQSEETNIFTLKLN